MATFKQSQIRPGVTKNRSNAIKVYVASPVAENDIIVATGMQGDFLSVEPADHTDISSLAVLSLSQTTLLLLVSTLLWLFRARRLQARTLLLPPKLVMLST